MEAAALGKPIVVGPCTDNFQLPVKALAAADAIRVVHSPRELASTVSAILGDKTLGSALGRRARDVVIRNQGATRRTVESIVRLLGVSRP
jgi:3-deoxy-D-manno-octulosonic-acid transferase